MKEAGWKLVKPKKSSYFGGGFDEELIQKAAEGGARLQKIQMIVWDYMKKPKHQRNGVDMAMEIEALFDKD